MKRILVVDDDENLREILSAMLGQRDRTIDTARDGIEALELLTQNQYDVILSDVSMPGLDGPALYEALRATPHTTPRVIFMSGNTGSGKHATFLQRANEPVLEKPFKLEAVRSLVDALLREG